MLLWDVFLAGQIGQLRRAPRFFRGVTALGGLLIAPAALVAVTSASILNGRAIHVIAWVWPLTLAIFARPGALRGRQATRHAVHRTADRRLRRHSSPRRRFVRYEAYTWRDPSAAALAIAAAQSSALGLMLGRVALFSPLAVQLPLLAPAYPARWRISATVRGTLADARAGVHHRVRRAAAERGRGRAQLRRPTRRIGLQERPRGDFTIGLRVFPALTDAPPPLALRNDMALVDSVGVGAIAVVIDPSGARLAALDSLARVRSRKIGATACC